MSQHIKSPHHYGLTCNACNTIVARFERHNIVSDRTREILVRQAMAKHAPVCPGPGEAKAAAPDSVETTT